MRNSSEVGKLAKTIKSDFASRMMTNIIQSLPTAKSSITSPKPTLIPVLRDTLDENYSEILKHATESGKVNVILFSNHYTFNLYFIRQSILSCNVEEDDIFVHTFSSTHTKEDIKTFLRKSKGFLICQDELFVGMEADSIVYLVSDMDRDKNLRVHVTRACSILNIVYCYEKYNYEYNDFPSAKLDPTFMDGCDEEIKCSAWQCKTCQKLTQQNNDYENGDHGVLVCKSCFLACHRGHQIERKSLVALGLHTQKLRCECKLKCLNCIL